jgi:GrpB-like predicted nucleotidyltransferase (UPF0157 family)
MPRTALGPARPARPSGAPERRARAARPSGAPERRAQAAGRVAGRAVRILPEVITVVEYDPAWPADFERLREVYGAAMTAAGVRVVAIEHVGSTSVPGLAAKPVIDCDIVVAEEDVEAASRVLVGMGFRPLGDLGIPQRWAFKEPVRLGRTNTYVIVEGSLSLKNHLAVRDTLRNNPGLRERYAAVKRQVGATAANIDEYGRGKEAIVQEILAAAGLSDAERASIGANQVPGHDEIPR